MTTEEMKQSVKQNRNWAVLGVAVGVVLIGGYVTFDWMMTPTMPNVQAATASEVVGYVTNPRGLITLTDIERRRFLDNWNQHIQSDDAARTEMATHLKSLNDGDRKVFVNSMFTQLKDIMVSDAKRFKHLPANEQNDFLFKKTEEFAKQKDFLYELATILQDEIPGQNQLRDWIFQHTTPEEREIIEPYFTALQRAMESRKRMEKHRDEAAAAAKGKDAEADANGS